jgi:hypothetical protein
VGSPYEDLGADTSGAAYLIHGPVTGELDILDAGIRIGGNTPDDALGIAVTQLGDMNADGQLDFALSATMYSTRPGSVYLFTDPPESDCTASSASATLQGVHDGDNAGSALAGAGDTNGDGFDDLLVGAYTKDTGGASTGCVYHLLGPVSGTRSLAGSDHAFQGIHNSQLLGSPRTLCQGADLDDDGYSDIVIGSPYFNAEFDYCGAVFIFMGPIDPSDSLTTADATLTGAAYSDKAGNSVAILGDVSGDGAPDLLVGTPGDDGGGEGAGAAYLVLGPFGGSSSLSEADATLMGANESDDAGQAVAAAGDVNADGVPDMLIGAWDAPAAYLVLGPGY